MDLALFHRLRDWQRAYHGFDQTEFIATFGDRCYCIVWTVSCWIMIHLINTGVLLLRYFNAFMVFFDIGDTRTLKNKLGMRNATYLTISSDIFASIRKLVNDKSETVLCLLSGKVNPDNREIFAQIEFLIMWRYITHLFLGLIRTKSLRSSSIISSELMVLCLQWFQIWFEAYYFEHKA